MRRAPAAAKLNLALVVGARRNGKHEVATVLQRVDLCDRVAVEPAGRLVVTGFAGDTLVGTALTRLAGVAGVRPRWRVRIEKHIPVSAGLGGGSSDAATALRLANETLRRPLGRDALHAVAAEVGADVPFFLAAGPQLGTAEGTSLEPLVLPQDYWVVLVLPRNSPKRSTAAVYAEFDRRAGHVSFEQRRSELSAALQSVRRPRDFVRLPQNDLAASPLAHRLEALGAFRSDVSGAGPAVYGLFARLSDARRAQRLLRHVGESWLTVPAWYF